MLSHRCLSVLSVTLVLWPNGWMDQDGTWYGGRPWPRRRCVRSEPSSPLKWAQPPIFGPCLLWPNGLMDQDATWYKGRLRPMPHCVRREPSSPPKGAQQPLPPLFGPCLLWPRSLLSSCTNGRPRTAHICAYHCAQYCIQHNALQY